MTSQGTERQGDSNHGEDLLSKYGEFLSMFQDDENADYGVVERVNSSTVDSGVEDNIGDLVVLDSRYVYFSSYSLNRTNKSAY